jgi:DNA (cytosine-5)-methyltransferase 1
LKKWKPVKDVLDFSDEGESIFTRKKPLSDKTLERIYAGLIKFVAGGKDNFLSSYYGVTKNFNRTYEQTAKSTDEPCGVLTTENRFAKVQAQFLSKYYSGHPDSKNKSIDEPADTITAIDHHAVVSASFIQQRNSGNPEHKVVSVDRPARTITGTGGNQELVQAKFLSVYCGSPHRQESNALNIDSPSPTVTAFDRLSLVSPKFIDQQYGNGRPSGTDSPLGCITTNPKYSLVCPTWIMNTNFSNVGSLVTEPCQTITANRKWHYLMNPQFFTAGRSVDDPCFTLIARMDKMPPYLVVAETGQIIVEVYDNDTEPMRKIKEFMAIYGIIDIKMRMLKIIELKRIMGFPEDYTLIGTKTEQKKYIGNAVEVNMSRVMCEALVKKLITINIYKHE